LFPNLGSLGFGAPRVVTKEILEEVELLEDEAEIPSMEWDLSKKEDDNPDQIPLFTEEPEAD
jgi:hypothetical protein